MTKTNKTLKDLLLERAAREEAALAQHPDIARLADYTDGLLDEAAMDEIRAHLAVCGACRAELLQLDEALEGIEEIAGRTAAERARLWAEFQSLGRQGSPSPAAGKAFYRRLSFAYGLAAMLLLGWVGSLFLVPAPPEVLPNPDEAHLSPTTMGTSRETASLPEIIIAGPLPDPQPDENGRIPHLRFGDFPRTSNRETAAPNPRTGPQGRRQLHRSAAARPAARGRLLVCHQGAARYGGGGTGGLPGEGTRALSSGDVIPAGLKAASWPLRLSLSLLFFCRAPAEPPELLAAGATVSFSLARGQSKSFRLHLEKDRYLRGRVLQNGVDVALHITTPSGERFPLDGFTACYGDEPFGFLTKREGWLLLRVEALKLAGEVILAMEPARPAQDRDRDFDRAFRARVRAGAEPSIAAGRPHFREAAAAWERAGEGGLAAEMRVWQAFGLQAGKRGAEALALAAQAARSLRAAAVLPRAVTALITLAFMRGQEGYGAGAEQSYRDAIALAEEGALPWLRGEAYRSLGLLKLRNGLLQQALFAFHQAILIFEEIGESEQRAAALSNLARAYTLMGAFDQAEAVLARALAAQRTLGASPQLGRSLTLQGRLLMLRNRFKEALRTLDEAQRVLRQSKSTTRRTVRPMFRPSPTGAWANMPRPKACCGGPSRPSSKGGTSIPPRWPAPTWPWCWKARASPRPP